MSFFKTRLFVPFQTFLERVQFWGCDISQAEAARTAETIFVHHFPCVLVIGLKNNQQNVIYRTSSPNNSLTQLVTKIETGKIFKIFKLEKKRKFSKI